MKRTNKLYLDSEAYDLNLEPEKRQNDFGTVTEKQVVSISGLWGRWKGYDQFGRLDSFLGPEKNILENFFEQVIDILRN